MKRKLKLFAICISIPFAAYLIYHFVEYQKEERFVEKYATGSSFAELDAAHAQYNMLKFAKAVLRNDIKDCKFYCQEMIYWYSRSPINVNKKYEWLANQVALEKGNIEDFKPSAETFIAYYENPHVQKSLIVYERVARDAEKEYEIVERYGDRRQMIHRAGMCAEAYLQAHDEANYRKWKDKERELRSTFY